MPDLDEEELKATREMKAINKIIAPEEKSADELFDDEGMWLEHDSFSEMLRMNDDRKCLRVDKLSKEIECYLEYTNDSCSITIDEMKALYKYLKELGWIE